MAIVGNTSKAGNLPVALVQRAIAAIRVYPANSLRMRATIATRRSGERGAGSASVSSRLSLNDALPAEATGSIARSFPWIRYGSELSRSEVTVDQVLQVLLAAALRARLEILIEHQLGQVREGSL